MAIAVPWGYAVKDLFAFLSATEHTQGNDAKAIVVTPYGLHLKAQGRAAHPGLARHPNICYPEGAGLPR
jgi:hypothetical protein